MTDPADWALSSCFSLPSGSAWRHDGRAAEVDLGANFGGNLRAAALTAEAATGPVPAASVAMTGLVAGTVTVSTRPVAASAMPAFWPMPLAAAKSVICRNGPRRRRASRCGSRGRDPQLDDFDNPRRAEAGPAARRRPREVCMVKKGSSLE